MLETVGLHMAWLVCVSGPLVGGLTNKFGCRAVTVCGSVLASFSVAVSSFSTHIDLLIATYGLLAGQFQSLSLSLSLSL